MTTMYSIISSQLHTLHWYKTRHFLTDFSGFIQNFQTPRPCEQLASSVNILSFIILSIIIVNQSFQSQTLNSRNERGGLRKFLLVFLPSFIDLQPSGKDKMSGEGELTNVCSVFFCSFAFLTISSSLFTFPTSSFTRNSNETEINMNLVENVLRWSLISVHEMFVCLLQQERMKAIPEIKLNKMRISANLRVWFDFYCNFHFLPVINKINFERANNVRIATLETTNPDFLFSNCHHDTNCHFVT